MKKLAIITLLITMTLFLNACGSGASAKKDLEYIENGNNELKINQEITPRLEDIAENEEIALNIGNPIYTQDDLNFFYEVALKSEYGNNSQQIKKWTKSIKLKLSGDIQAEDHTIIEDIIAELHEILPENIRIKLVSSGENANLKIISKEEIKRLTGKSHLRGYVTIWPQTNGIITKSQILIGSFLNSSSRKHVIREELTQSLGLLNDSYKEPKSIFYNGMSFTSQYAPIDIKSIALLYNPTVSPGMTKSQLQNLIQL